jgi:uncharacterized membrane protein
MKIFEIISQEQRMKIVEDLSKAVRPSFPFYFMTVLSTLIVAYGLLSSSCALIIVGVFLSPLPSSVFAFSLSLIKGDIHLMRRSIHSAATCVLLGFAVSIVLVLIVPGASVSSEMLARTKPNIFDLIMGLAAGLGTGYILTREGVWFFLPGIVLALLLVPPIGVAGIGLALRNYGMLGGASLLFTTYLISMITGNSIIFWGRGFIPYWSSRAHEEVKKKLFLTVLILIIVAAPLIGVMVSVINQTAVSNTISSVLTQELAAGEGTQIISYTFDETKSAFDVDVTLRTSKHISTGMVRSVKSALEGELKKSVELKLNIISFKELSAK